MRQPLENTTRLSFHSNIINNNNNICRLVVVVLIAIIVVGFFGSSSLVNAINQQEEEYKTLDNLPSFSKLKNLTVSGFGAGASMAIMMQVAHSQKVGGVASFSGLPYYCVKNNMSRLETCFKHTEKIPMSEFMEMFDKFIYFNLIDNLDHLPSHKIYLQSGSKDKSLTQQAALKSKEMYETLGVPKGNIKTVLDIPSGHSMVSVDYANAEKNQCGEKIKEPYIQNCGFDLVGDALKFVIGEDNFVNEANFVASAENLFKIDQRPFDSERHLMGDFGYIYIPSACQKDETKCKHIHVAFHGCDQTGDEFPLYSGYNRIAEQNNIVVLYPRTAVQDRFNPHAW
ncbi:predicted protein [Naegleria gruberi]|uniref:Predicted protein n=1 Tax=Naegleria gruberi TaxID=5762 RepID=D2VUH1_NAEGR|nr:uncharacterized protein NAEGRDRAFT_72661 [Naegleria gruberi]EFC39448.1 predicted protein [Naegleria gruberi]|eukprot:XP_002672192.1 predicted protein [Naegleria gruberi strain NEG-M]